ncbi:MAG: hypothetical protein M1596_01200 [Firmicutes bacterium]|jgi:hypothetical protein|nr:hypothetical protein [Bacillota bacterium]
MWEEYLDQSTSLIVNKYHARRAQAKIRQQLLSLYGQYIERGMEPRLAQQMAMVDLGRPELNAQKFALPDRRQRGWLWLISFSQLLIGIGLVGLGWRTESLATLALGRILALWGFVATAMHTANQNGLRQNLALLRLRLHRRGQVPQGLYRMILVGAISGVAAALLCSLPWNFVTTNTIHPVFVSESSSVMLSLIAAWGPWLVFRKHLVRGFRSVSLQVVAALSGTLVYTLLLVWKDGFVPPPLFNWNSEMFLLGSFVYYFALIRGLTFIVGVKQRIEPWTDEELRSTI